MIVAVIGLGSIGRRHARNLVKLGATVVGFDPNQARAVEAESIGVEAAASREDALSRANAAIIASPTPNHLDDLRAALEYDCPAFVEKPIAHTTSQLPDLLRRADQCDRVVFAALNLRYRPSVQRAKAVIAEGRIGTPLWARMTAASYLPHWRPGTDHRLGYAADIRTGGVLFDIVHEFDLAIHFVGPGETVAAAARQTGFVGIPSDDCADVILRHENGAQTTLHLDYLTRPPIREVDVAGSEGRLRLDLLHPRLAVFDTSGALALDHAWPADDGADYLAEMEAFLACVNGEREPLCDGWEALRVLKQVIAARRLAALPDSDDSRALKPVERLA